jgi:hypothetical protein
MAKTKTKAAAAMTPAEKRDALHRASLAAASEVGRALAALDAARAAYSASHDAYHAFCAETGQSLT